MTKKKVIKYTRRYFTSLVKSSNRIEIDNTVLEPKNLVYGKEFKELYLKQLIDNINSDDFDLEKYKMMLLGYEFIKEDKYPIYISSKLSERYKLDIVSALNKFYKDHLEVLELLYNMYVGKIK